MLNGDGLDRLVRAVAGISGTGATVSRRVNDDGNSWLFAFNHGDAPATVPVTGVELLSGRDVAGTLELAPGDVAVIRETDPRFGAGISAEGHGLPQA
jgi:beta-galactosidase